MENREKEQMELLWSEYLTEDLIQIILSHGKDPDRLSKVKVRPLTMRGRLIFQAEEFSGNQAFHKNLTAEEGILYLTGCMEKDFKQAELTSRSARAHILIGKKGTVTIKRKAATPVKMAAVSSAAEHNRKKQYILEEGRPVPFLTDLGVMTAEGRVVNARYDKFRQINRFLEFIEDILPRLSRDRELTVIDFGCGKSYLTFAMYYYLHELKGYPVHIVGLDLKESVIKRCNILAESYGYGEHLHFLCGDIASYEGVKQVDMVVTLHACDTATDQAIAKAISWGASVILSVPCCQHELNSQLKSETLGPVLEYGLIKERMAALCTDGLRAEILEYRGYRTQVLEFIDMEHTPKNILIRAVKQGTAKDNQKEIRALMDFLHVKPALVCLSAPELL